MTITTRTGSDHAESGSALKIIQWATGNIGARALRAVLEHPQMELAGLWVHSADKVGRDAAELCGAHRPSGIVAGDDGQQLSALSADCVLYMRQGTDAAEICTLLASGKNIVTTRGDFHHPGSMDAALRDRIEQACAEGQTTIYSTGSSPGFVTEALPISLLSLSRRLDCLTIDEFADLSSRNSPALLFDVMGFGAPLSEFDQGKVDYVKADFAASLAALAQCHAIAIDSWEGRGEYSPATQRVEIAAGTIEEGTVAAQRITITGMKDGQPKLRFRANWYASDKIANRDWQLRESGWRLQIAGDTPLDMSISFPVAPEDYAAFTPGLTAHRAVNAIPAVCAAPPGIATTASLGHVLADLSDNDGTTHAL